MEATLTDGGEVGKTLCAEARIISESGQVCVQAEGTFVIVGDADPVTGDNTIDSSHQHLVDEQSTT